MEKSEVKRVDTLLHLPDRPVIITPEVDLSDGSNVAQGKDVLVERSVRTVGSSVQTN